MVANVFGYNCLISNNSQDIPYVFFPAESVLAPDFLKLNNLYRNSALNADTTKKGFFEEG